MQNNLLHIVLAILLVVLLVLLTDPFMLWMPMGMQMAALLGATVLLAVWAGYVVRERGGDERDISHRMHAGRVAYLSGIAILTFALIAQGLSHHIDPWISAALAAMVLSKVAAHFYLDMHH